MVKQWHETQYHDIIVYNNEVYIECCLLDNNLFFYANDIRYLCSTYYFKVTQRRLDIKIIAECFLVKCCQRRHVPYCVVPEVSFCHCFKQ